MFNIVLLNTDILNLIKNIYNLLFKVAIAHGPKGETVTHRHGTVGRGSLVLRHSASYFPLNSGSIAC